ncbi:oxygenase MpaB family protein [Sphingomonas sp. CARO-RG-8B-R24-01]|uniref:oxygenase MpaB family protein n=1 Tax=Sphingomonas sp. CARO-RG-8B-R24-01 TaxID=2914831 RepID=UPI001F573002|nr:oxygenase MpaB family protein [Sphingomonas sp. CARO-RG-8B-R24-01]
MSPADRLSRPLKGMIVGQVRALFNDQARGERPVQRRDDALFPPDSVAWRVHGDVTSMLVGGIAALLLQMLHPSVLAGVWDHSGFRDDMQGRLRRTARFIAVTTYGAPDDARALLAKVRRIHDHIGGTLPDGTSYRASDPALLAWVHVSEVLSFLDGWIRYGEPGMSRADQDRYVAEMARIAEPLGVEAIPRTRAEAEALQAAMRPQLKVDARTRDVATVLLRQPAPSLAARPFQTITMQAAIDLLPGWARTMHGLERPGLGVPLLRAGTFGVASTLRWAFRG